MDRDRLDAWGAELQRVHRGLRDRLTQIRASVASGDAVSSVENDLRLYCAGLCTWITGHHTAEDRRLFPVVEDAQPELAPVLKRLHDDHLLIATVIADLEASLPSAESGALLRHLDGLAAILDSHFGYEERSLTEALNRMTATEPSIADLLGARPPNVGG